MSAYSSAILALGPLAYWRLDEASGSFADASGHSQTLVDNLPAVVTYHATGLLASDADQAISINGNSSIAINPPVNINDVFTLEAWVKLTSTAADGCLISSDAGGGMFRVSGGKLQGVKSGVVVICDSGTTTLATNTTYHCVYTKNGATNHLYVNGVDVTANVANQTCANGGTASQYTTLGSDFHATAGFLAGTIDEAAIYGFALTPTQVAQNYTNGITVTATAAGTGAITFAGSGIATFPVVALVGTIGALSAGTTTVTPAWGSGQTRTAGNLLTALVTSYGANTIGTPAGWTKVGGADVVQGSMHTAILWKVATGADAAPAITGGATRISAQLDEWSHPAGWSSPFDTSGSQVEASNVAATTVTASPDPLQTGALLLIVFQWFKSATTFSSGASGSNVALNALNNDGATSLAQHHLADWGRITAAATTTYAAQTIAQTGTWASELAVFRSGVIATGTGTGAIVFGGSGVGTVTVTGTGTGAIVFSGSGTATVSANVYALVVGTATTGTASARQTTVATNDKVAVLVTSGDWSSCAASTIAVAGTAAFGTWTRTSAGSGGHCENAVFTATATTGGTMTPTVTFTGSAVNGSRATFVVVANSASTGFGPVTTTATTATESVTASVGSTVMTCVTDWNAGPTNAVTYTPGGAVEDLAVSDDIVHDPASATEFSVMVAHWAGVASGAVTRGVASPTGGIYNVLAVEFRMSVVAGTGTGAIVFAGSGTATVTTVGTGTGVITFAGSGTATVTSVGTGTGAITFAGSGTATAAAGVTLAGVVGTVVVAAPAGGVVPGKNLAGVTAAVTVAAPAGSVAAGTGLNLVGVVGTVTVAAPAGQIRLTPTLAGAVAVVTVAAPAGARSGSPSIVGVLGAVAVAGPAGNVVAPRNLVGGVATVTVTGPAGTVVAGGGVNLPGAAGLVAVAATAGLTATGAAIAGQVGTVTVAGLAGARASSPSVVGTTGTVNTSAPPGTTATAVNLAGVTAAVTAVAPAGTIVAGGGVNLPGVAAAVAVLAPAGLLSAGSTTAVGVAAVAVAGPVGAIGEAPSILGTAAAVAVVAPAGALAEPTVIAGVAGTVAVAAPTGTVVVGGGVNLPGIPGLVVVAAPAGTVAAAAVTTGVTAAVTVAAPPGTTVTVPLLTGVTAAVAVAAPAGTVTAPQALLGVVATVTVAAPAGAATMVATVNLAGPTAAVTVVARAGSFSATPVLAGQPARVTVAAPRGLVLAGGQVNELGTPGVVTVASYAGAAIILAPEHVAIALEVIEAPTAVYRRDAASLEAAEVAAMIYQTEDAAVEWRDPPTAVYASDTYTLERL